MNAWTSLAVYLAVGAVGGYLGSQARLPGGTIIGAMLAVIALQLLTGRHWDIPQGYGFVVQILIGVMVGLTFQPQMLKILRGVAIPVVSSTLILVVTGLAIAVVLTRIGLLDAATAYLSTSPGAMTAMIPLAVESQASPPVVLAFHFFRVVFVLVTAPFLLKLTEAFLSIKSP